ncbi:hypothetical protein B5E58_12390 [Tyzzerella sp. An114]|uniref:recombinase zinc beta ribbon domain-containing protein n=1 Tax=Tyzzerella sp. An114 TaxID=1965545 RepID=UPI000B43BAA5|nr:recombinase zinc beta ribbon domain-containing protein [Tyzzerella sp. An114]OUQ55371.1 hypothetical protein B5E58_12390 [Tyzzerella sp. An114]
MAVRRLPYGYRFDGTTIIIDDIEGKVVKEIYELFCEGVYITKIKNYIKNFYMSRHKVKRILEDDVYTGKNDLPPIIDEDLFETAQKIKNQRLNEIGKNQDKSYSYVKENFENKIVCGECGADYHRYKRGEEYIWNCSHKVFKRKVCCRNISLSDKQIENIWSNVIQKINENPKLLQPQKTISNKNLGRYNALDREIKMAETGEKEYTQEELIKLIYKRASVMYEMSHYKEEIEKIDITALDKFIVYKNRKIKIILKNGAKIEEKI